MERGRTERKSQALVRERVIYALIMQQPRFITGDTRCLADSEISISRRDNPRWGEGVETRGQEDLSCPLDTLWKSGYHPARDVEITEIENCGGGSYETLF